MSFIDDDRRLVILRLLKEAGGEANESTLKTGLHEWKHLERAGVTREKVRQYLHELEDADCITTELLDGRIMAAKISRRGLNALSGAELVPGVKRPSLLDD